LWSQEPLKSLPQVRGVVAVTIHLAGDAAPQRILVEREKVIVMELVMEVIMMETRAVKQALCVVVIIVRNMATITMRRMIAVRNLPNGLLHRSPRWYKVRGVKEGTLLGADAAHLRHHVA